MLTPPNAPVDPLTGLFAARFGVYVHFPYCLSKCPYCDFASTVAARVPEERYADAVLAELSLRLEAAKARAVDSIYFGGGTPSLWGARHIERVLETLARHLPFSKNVEITLEANPGASDAERFGDLRSAGINRLSLGVQSFQASTLKALGRAHDGAQASAAYEAARKGGFQNVSLDFIYGVHGQELSQVVEDARQAVALGPEHLSAYALTLDREVLAEEVPLARQLARGEVALPPDEHVLRMAREVRQTYSAAGLGRYEISNFARQGLHSRHNSLYWTGGEYLALGAGAAGYVSIAPGKGERYSNLRSAEQYLGAVEAGRLPEAGRELLGPGELFAERLAMGLRLCTGVNLRKVCEDFGQPLAPRLAEAGRLVQNHLARWSDDRLALTEAGLDLHSAVSAKLI